MALSTGEILKALADETRLRIVSLLLESRNLCACEVEAILELNQSNASRHLTRLRQAGLLTATRSGTWVHFSPAADKDTEAHWQLIEHAINLAREESPLLQEDLKRLQQYRASGQSCRTINRITRKPTTRIPERRYILTK